MACLSTWLAPTVATTDGFLYHRGKKQSQRSPQRRPSGTPERPRRRPGGKERKEKKRLETGVRSDKEPENKKPRLCCLLSPGFPVSCLCLSLRSLRLCGERLFCCFVFLCGQRRNILTHLDENQRQVVGLFAWATELVDGGAEHVDDLAGGSVTVGADDVTDMFQAE